MGLDKTNCMKQTLNRKTKIQHTNNNKQLKNNDIKQQTNNKQNKTKENSKHSHRHLKLRNCAKLEYYSKF